MLFPKSMAKLKAYQERAKNLSPLEAAAVKVVKDANRERALEGIAPDGKPYAPLAASTVKERLRRGYPAGPPLARRGAASAIVTGCVVTASSSGGTLTLAKGWPGVSWVGYAAAAGRNPQGYSDDERARLRALLRNHVLSGGS